MTPPDALSDALSRTRWSVLVVGLLAATMALQLFGAGVWGAVKVPQGIPNLGVSLFLALLVNLGGAFFLFGAVAAATRTDDPGHLSRAIVLRTVGFALVAPATLTWVWVVAVAAILILN